MKKVIASIALVAMLFVSNAQSQKWGFVAGLTLGNNTLSGAGKPANFKSVATPGSEIGIVRDYSCKNGKWVVRPQIRFAFLNQDISYSSAGYFNVTRRTSSHLLLPIDVIYKLPSKKYNGNLYLGVGPYLTFGMKSTDNIKESNVGQLGPYYNQQKTSVEWGDKVGEMYKSDVGFNFSGGWEFKNGLFVRLHYRLGMRDVLPDKTVELRNRDFGIGIGYMPFCIKKKKK
jgi:hypothetical protein